MTVDEKRVEKAYSSDAFVNSREARPLRILAEYLHPASRFESMRIADTIVFWGSARLVSREKAISELEAARTSGADTAATEFAEARLHMSRYYEDCRELARRLTEWSKALEERRRRFVICTGGGPGIMEAANRGASEARGMNMGLTISLPHEQRGNIYITRQLELEFHYFFMRKYWFVYLAKALVAFPGGFGTLDEFFEVMTLVQTRKIRKKLPILLYGTEFWDQVLNLEAMVKFGTIDRKDLDLFHKADSVDEAFEFITSELSREAVSHPGGRW